MAAAWEASELKSAVLTKPIDELSGHSQDLGCLGRSHLIVSAEHDDPRPMRHIIQHRAHGSLDG